MAKFNFKKLKENKQENIGKSKNDKDEIKEVSLDTIPKMPSNKQVSNNQENLNANTQKYPLTPINLDEDELESLGDAKKRILGDIKLYNFTIQSIVNESDFANIKGKKHLCKSGVRKIQLALNISTKIIDEEYWKEEGSWIAKYKVKAITPSGRFAESIGVCTQKEGKQKRTFHDTMATAQTRATSRAILDLVGFGAVSESEINY